MNRKKWVLLGAPVLAVWLAASGQTARAQDRFAIGAHVAVEHLPVLGATPVGYGFRFTYGAYLPFLSFDSEINLFPTRSTGNLGQTQAFFGLKAGARIGSWGVFLKARPGVARFGGGAAPQRLTHRTNFALDLGGGVEHYFAPHLALRWDLSNVMTHFGDGMLLAGPGGPIGTRLGTKSNFQTTVGLQVHF